jgi:hypothetical protein
MLMMTLAAAMAPPAGLAGLGSVSAASGTKLITAAGDSSVWCAPGDIWNFTAKGGQRLRLCMCGLYE